MALIVAHRGAWGPAPQNSLGALEAAIKLGCDMVEVDVRRTRDGRLVAIHDPRVGGAAVGALHFDELQQEVRPGEVPVLTEFLDAAAGRIALDVELKEAGYEAQVTATLSQHLPAAGYVVTSFIPAALAAVRQSAPHTRTGLLLRPGPGSRTPERRVRDSGVDFLAPHVRLARAGLLAWAAERGLASFVWTVNNRRLMRTMLKDARVAAVITDRPSEALGLRRDAHSRERPEHDHAGDHESDA